MGKVTNEKHNVNTLILSNIDSTVFSSYFLFNHRWMKTVSSCQFSVFYNTPIDKSRGTSLFIVALDFTKDTFIEDLEHHLTGINRFGSGDCKTLVVGVSDSNKDDELRAILSDYTNTNIINSVTVPNINDVLEDFEQIVWEPYSSSISSSDDLFLPDDCYSNKDDMIKTLETYVEHKEFEENGKSSAKRALASFFTPKTCGSEKIRVAKKMLEGIKNGEDIDNYLTDSEKETVRSGRFNKNF